MNEPLTIIGGGLAGVESAWQLAIRGKKVILYEKRPFKMSPAHSTGLLAELVCSNSFKSKEVTHPHGLLKEELKRLNSLVINAAFKFSLPGGKALTVDRKKFSEYITEKIENHPNINVIREEVKKIPEQGIVIIATGPLTEGELAEEIRNLIGQDFFYFYDALSPIVSADSLNMEKLYFKDRHGWDNEGYLNAPMTEQEYLNFWSNLVKAEIHKPKDFEKNIKFFEGCLPIEEMAKRGYDTLRCGPLRPDNLEDPRTGKKPYAVVQLRREDKEGKAFSLVGFQTQLKIDEQKRVFRLIPGLEKAEFLRYGAVHRNSYILSPLVLNHDLSLKKDNRIFFAGQIIGTEGYTESVAGGLYAGIQVFLRLEGLKNIPFPTETAIGALMNYVTSSEPEKFSPMNINLSLFHNVIKTRNKRKKYEFIAKRSLETLEKFITNFPELITIAK